MVGYKIRMSFSEEMAVDETEFSFFTFVRCVFVYCGFQGGGPVPYPWKNEVFNCLAKGMNVRGLKPFIKDDSLFRVGELFWIA